MCPPEDGLDPINADASARSANTRSRTACLDSDAEQASSPTRRCRVSAIRSACRRVGALLDDPATAFDVLRGLHIREEVDDFSRPASLVPRPRRDARSLPILRPRDAIPAVLAAGPQPYAPPFRPLHQGRGAAASLNWSVPSLCCWGWSPGDVVRVLWYRSRQCRVLHPRSLVQSAARVWPAQRHLNLSATPSHSGGRATADRTSIPESPTSDCLTPPG